MQCHLICGSLFPAAEGVPFLQINPPSLDGLSCWCKAIVTILLIPFLEQTAAGILWDVNSLPRNLAQSPFHRQCR
jgi:hypothetical protein